MVVVFGGRLVCLLELLCFSFTILCPSEGEGDACFLRQDSECFPEADPFLFHHEGEDIASRAAGPETMPALALWEHVERWGLFLVERTDGFEVTSSLLQVRHVAGNRFDYVYSLFYFVDGVHSSYSSSSAGDSCSSFSMEIVTIGRGPQPF